MSGDEEALAAGNGQGLAPTVPGTSDSDREQRRAAYRERERRRNELAMDRFIEYHYGPDAVARSRR